MPIAPVTITTDPQPFEVGEKRFYIPGVVLTSKCPECGEEVTKDLADRYLSYPTANKPIEVSMCHEIRENGHYNGEHEWTVRVVLRITVEPAP